MKINRLGIRVYSKLIGDYYEDNGYIYSNKYFKFRFMNNNWFGIMLYKRYGNK
jgi:hypothetical protein